MKMYTIMTKAGIAAIANASVNQEKIEFFEMALGDGNGNYPNINENMTALVNEVWRGKINHVELENEETNQIKLTSVIPAKIGGFSIREIGVFDNLGNLLAIGRYPLLWKPSVTDGAIAELTVRMVIQVSNANVVNIKIDPTVINSTLKDLENLRVDVDKDIKNLDSKLDSSIAVFDESLNNKVNKDGNKVLSDNNYTTAEKDEVKKIKDKVDKIDGKGLSTNDYTNTEKEEVKKIKNKVDEIDGKGLSTNDYTDTDKNEVGKIESKANITDIPDIVNNLTDGGISKTLSAEQGKLLKVDLDAVKQHGNNGKNLVKNRIIAKKGVVDQVGTVPTFEELGNGIDTIITDPSIGTTAIPSDVLSGKTTVSNGEKFAGTMPIITPEEKILANQKDKIFISEGYHDGTGSVEVDILNLVPENIKSGINVGNVVGEHTGGLKYLGEIVSERVSGSGDTYHSRDINIDLPKGVKFVTTSGVSASVGSSGGSSSSDLTRIQFHLISSNGEKLTSSEISSKLSGEIQIDKAFGGGLGSQLSIIGWQGSTLARDSNDSTIRSPRGVWGVSTVYENFEISKVRFSLILRGGSLFSYYYNVQVKVQMYG